MCPIQLFFSLGNDRRPYADDWPYMGTVVGARRPMHPRLPNALTLPHKPSKAPYTRPGQFAARLGVEHDPLYINGSLDNPLSFHAPALVLAGGVTTEQLRSRQQLLDKLDAARRSFDHNTKEQTWKHHQARTLDLLMSSSATEAFDVASEPVAVRERYGSTINAMSLLLARRLAEAEVPLSLFLGEDESIAKKCASEGAWDTHGNNFNCLKENLLPEFDRAFSALVEDLAQRGLLDQNTSAGDQ